MEQKLYQQSLDFAELDLQKVNGLFVNEGYRCTSLQLSQISKHAKRIVSILENVKNDVEGDDPN